MLRVNAEAEEWRLQFGIGLGAHVIRPHGRNGSGRQNSFCDRRSGGDCLPKLPGRRHVLSPEQVRDWVGAKPPNSEARTSCAFRRGGMQVYASRAHTRNAAQLDAAMGSSPLQLKALHLSA